MPKSLLYTHAESRRTNRWLLAVASAATVAFASIAAAADLAEPTVVARGPHSRVWQRTTTENLSNGRVRTNFNSFVELGSGLHRWDEQTGAWVDADDIIRVVNGNGIGTGAAHQLIFSPNANTAGSIDLLTPDNKRLRSHCVGLAFFEPRTGRSEMFATLKDSIGELHPPNTVVYPDTFDGVKADLVYINRIGSFEQNVVLRENRALPEGWLPAETVIECWTEFLQPPESAVAQRARAGMIDDTLDFGAMQTSVGRAFALGEENAKSSAVVVKRWLSTEGRTFLVEQVRYVDVKAQLDTLPPANGQARIAPRQQTLAEQQASLRPFPAGPPTREARAKIAPEKFRTASVTSPSPLGGERAGVRGAGAPISEPAQATASVSPSPLGGERVGVRGAMPAERGLVIDYTLQSSLTNFTFQGDTTYVCSNAVTLYQTTTFEGNCVVKFAKTAAAVLNLGGTVVWRSAMYRPAIFTAVDDHTVGEKIGTNTVSGYYGGQMLSFTTTTNGTPSHLRISYATTGLKSGGSTLTLRHAQFVHCLTAIDHSYGSGSFTNENVLFYDIGTLHYGNSYMFGSHLTIHQCTNFANGSASSDAQLVNSLLIGLISEGTAGLSLTSSYWNDEEEPGVFQTVGGAAHYLAANSPHRNAGSTLSGPLATEIKQLTTYPPVVLTSVASSPLVLIPQAQRDSDIPDLGYHYDVLDFACNGLALGSATLDIRPGTAIATFGSAGAAYGIAMNGGSSLLCEGSPANLNRLVRYNMAQEQANTNWSTLRGPTLTNNWHNGAAPYVRVRFTEWSVPASDTAHFYGTYAAGETADLADCQFSGGSLVSYEPALNVTNCLFQRVNTALDDSENNFSANFCNCLFFGGALNLHRVGTGTWVFNDNLISTTNITTNGTLTADYNGYLTNAVRLPPFGTHDRLLATSTFSFQDGPLGWFYQLTNSALINAGSTYATNLGLYHFTTTTNQVKESGSLLDIGFHYVAVTNGVPYDTDGDGLPDYAEDWNGNGVFGTGETDWTSYNSLFGLTGLPGLQVFTPLK